jgi:competence protein ComEA
MVDLPEITRRQLLIWSVIGIVIILVGARYMLAQGGAVESPASGATAATVGLKEEVVATIKVHIVGAVAAPGLYDLEQGCRIADAVAVAGGPLPTADLARINLAAKLADGQQLVIPDASDPSVIQGSSGSGTVDDGPISLNSATADQLMELDGIGPKTAEKIINYREEQGGFSHVEELMDVPGIGPAKFEQIKDRVIV